jgi:hypothetical protein
LHDLFCVCGPDRMDCSIFGIVIGFFVCPEMKRKSIPYRDPGRILSNISDLPSFIYRQDTLGITEYFNIETISTNVNIKSLSDDKYLVLQYYTTSAGMALLSYWMLNLPARPLLPSSPSHIPMPIVNTIFYSTKNKCKEYFYYENVVRNCKTLLLFQILQSTKQLNFLQLTELIKIFI